MIFGKLTLGGFDILMSKKIPVKKSCLSELGQNGGLALAWIDITWAELSEKSPKTSKQLRPYFITAQINQKTPPITPKTTPDTRDTNKHCKTSSDTLRRPTETRWTPLKRSQTPSHHLCTTLEGKIIFNLNLLRHQNIKTSLCKLAKNHWVWPFFLIFRSVREKL